MNAISITGDSLYLTDEVIAVEASIHAPVAILRQSAYGIGAKHSGPVDSVEKEASETNIHD